MPGAWHHRLIWLALDEDINARKSKSDNAANEPNNQYFAQRYCETNGRHPAVRMSDMSNICLSSWPKWRGGTVIQIGLCNCTGNCTAALLALSGLPNANAKSPRFTYAISQITSLPPVVALNRNSKSQIAARYAAFWHAVSQIALASFL